MYNTGDVVVVDFPGVNGFKRRPAVIVSSDLYHTTRPDVIVGLITSQVASATSPTDYVLQNWAAANLRQASAFRSFLYTVPRNDVYVRIGRLTTEDLKAVLTRLGKAVAEP